MPNGIENSLERPDLADRAIFLTLERIAAVERRTERSILHEFDARHPYILGALLDALVIGLHELPGIQTQALPRMADFAQWAIACEQATWPAGTFIGALIEIKILREEET